MRNNIDNKINFGFFGTPEVASETLEILKEKGFIPLFIITSPDAKKGRGLHLQASPVAIFAEKNNIPCLKPEKLDENFNLVVGVPNGTPTTKWDLFIVVAYGKIIPEKIINMPKLGSINIHYSLLPKYRGASPVESAIRQGDTETGITIQKMKFKMDSGPIIAQKKVFILPDEKAPDLRRKLIKIGGELLVKILPEFAAGKIKLTPQNESLASVCKKIKKEDGLVNLEKEPPSVLYNKFRAYAYWPRTFFFVRRNLGKGRFSNIRTIITDAELRDNKFVIKRVLPEGKKEIKYEDFQKLSNLPDRQI
ncbi:MAG: methionyl-tRNA formyltransferase [Patescibacteria group bacterium]